MKIFSILLIILTVLPSFGKELNVALLGDSMTWIGGENFDQPKGWTYYLTSLPMNMKLYARSGATWTNTTRTKHNPTAYTEVLDDDNVIYNQIIRLNEDTSFHPDIIVIYAGANDAWFVSKRPQVFQNTCTDPAEITENSNPKDYTSLEGSIVLGCTLLRNQFPGAEIYLVSPVHAGKIDPKRIEMVGNIMETAAGRLSVPVVRGDKEIPFIHNQETGTKRVNTYDGVHSNERGARLIAECLKERIFQPQIANQSEIAN